MFLQNIRQDFQSKRFLVAARPAGGRKNNYDSRFKIKYKAFS